MFVWILLYWLSQSQDCVEGVALQFYLVETCLHFTLTAYNSVSTITLVH